MSTILTRAERHPSWRAQQSKGLVSHTGARGEQRDEYGQHGKCESLMNCMHCSLGAMNKDSPSSVYLTNPRRMRTPEHPLPR